jgi:hypothetical protein
MGFVKVLQMSSLVDVQYWRIVEMHINFDRLDAVIILSGYLSRDARDSMASPITSFQFNLNGDYLMEMRDTVLRAAYTCFKNLLHTELSKPMEDQDGGLITFSGVEDLL